MFILVLNDGKTYSEISGCLVVQLPDIISPDDIEGVLDGLRECDRKFWKDHVVTEFQ